MHLTPGVVHNFPKAVGVLDFCPICKIKRTVWKNSYAEHEVTGRKSDLLRLSQMHIMIYKVQVTLAHAFKSML